MIRVLNSLVKSFDYFNNNYELIVYTNVEIPLQHPRVKIVQYDLNAVEYIYCDPWRNISFHKLIVAGKLLETGISPIWIDLDTIICRNVDHLIMYPNLFVMHGSNDTTQNHIVGSCYIETRNYIQGNIWKVTSDLLKRLMYIWDNMWEKPLYDSQALFNYAYHFKDMNSEMKILGKDYDIDTINGLEICTDKDVIVSPVINLLADELCMQNNKIISTRLNKEIQFFSFTFFTLVNFLDYNHFARFKDPAIVEFFKSCGYAL